MRKKVELHYLIKEIILSKSFSYWERTFNSLNIPWAPVNSSGDVIQDPHLKERQVFYNYFNMETGEEEFQIRFPAVFSTSLPAL